MEKPIASQGEPINELEIYETLFVFIDEFLYNYKPLTKETEEDKITQNIEYLLNEETHDNDNGFIFQNQYKEGIYTTDIGVYLRSMHKVFCWIEAKRLPTPDRGKKCDDEREYVIVDKMKGFKGNGGIQRFKENKHAKNLHYSIMFGYIQDKNNTDYWLLKINTWIKELINEDNEFWNNEDCLVKCNTKKCDSFFSVHKRKDKTTITLYHYWIKI
ncbi:hypothetical protein R84B8_00073 [Treponema sp. R8-4-B8]